MKVLITYDDRIRHDSTAVYFYHAFQKLCTVVKAYPEELEYIKPGMFDLHIKIDDGLFPTTFPKALHPSAYYVIDTHIDASQRLKTANESDFDYIFCAQPDGINHEWGNGKAEWLPLACSPDHHYVPWKQPKRYDVCFIGGCSPNWQSKRIERLDKLFKAFPNFYFGNLFFNEMAMKFAASRIVFNSAFSNDINMRVFEAMCSGSLLLTDKQNWQELFEGGAHLVAYDNDDEIVSMADYYLKNPEQREVIAIRGQKEVLEKHTYSHRAKEILNKCKSTK